MASCGTCHHFSALAKECRAHVPVPFVVAATSGQPVVLTVWPRVEESQSCGEWKE